MGDIKTLKKNKRKPLKDNILKFLGGTDIRLVFRGTYPWVKLRCNVFVRNQAAPNHRPAPAEVLD